MNTEHSQGAPPSAASWLGFVVCALPLLLLFLLFASGIAVPFWLYAVALLWCVLMPLWMGGHQHRAERRPAGHVAHSVPGVRHAEHAAIDPAEATRAASQIAGAVPESIFELRGWEVQPTGIILRGALRAAPAFVQERVAQAARAALGRSPQVMVHQDGDGSPYILIASSELEDTLSRALPRRRPWVNFALALATLGTTTFAGSAHQGINLLERPGAWTVGLPYALGVMLILGVHEMGHYLTARSHGVQVSLPYFIPVPFALGTFGAFISMPPLLRNRRQLFDIGVAGPLAGLAVAVPTLMVGLQWSEVLPVDTAARGHMSHGVSVNASVLLTLLAKLSIGERVAEGHYLVLHPLAFAGWLGLMITALNLLPVGQLDGGHVAHGMFGRARADWLGKVALFAMVLLGLFVWSGLLMWVLVVFFVAGTRGIPPMDDVTGLEVGRKALGWFAFALLALILLPVPHALSSALGLHCPYL